MSAVPYLDTARQTAQRDIDALLRIEYRRAVAAGRFRGVNDYVSEIINLWRTAEYEWPDENLALDIVTNTGEPPADVEAAIAEAAANVAGLELPKSLLAEMPPHPAVPPPTRERGEQRSGADAKAVTPLAPQAHVWSEPQPIEATLAPVPAFDTDVLLPPVIRDWVADIADRMPCAVEYVATTALVIAATIIGARCAIKPKQRDDWAVIPNLWGAIVGPPASKKTPSISAAMRALDRLISRAIDRHGETLRGFEADAIIREARKQAIDNEIRQAVRAERGGKGEGGKNLQDLKNEVLAAAAESDEKPALRRYRTNDTTVERLGELLRDNPTGMLAFRDELTGLLASMDREGREGDRAFYLEGWNGNSSFDTDRIARGTIRIPNLCVSVFGGIQPDKLTQYLEQAANSLANDGMLPRFQLLVYPDPVLWRYVDREPNNAAQRQVFEVFERLDELNPVDWGAAPADDSNRFPAFRFDSEAQEVFIEWAGGHHHKNESEDNPLIAQHLDKYDKLFPALALIFHLLDIADGKQPGPVTRDCALRAAAWCQFLEAHARRCYGLLADQGLRAARTLAAKIEAEAVQDAFTARDIRRRQWRYLTTDDAINAALEWLEDAGWLQQGQTGGIGRRTIRYRINPARLSPQQRAA